MQKQHTSPNPILVATDFSHRSERAVRRAACLAKRFTSRLVLVHIVDDDRPSRLVVGAQKEAAALLEETRRALYQSESIDCDYMLETGEASSGVLDIAERRNAELIVVGAHRRSIFKKVFVGTTAERIIRNTSRPVLMAASEPADDYDRILLPVDPTYDSGRTLAVIDRMGLAKSTAVTVVYVFATPEMPHLRRASLSQDRIDAYRSHRREDSEDALKAFLTRNAFASAHLRVQENKKGIVTEIAQVADETRANLLVLATHQRRGLDKLFLGSVTEELLSRAKWDILAVPAASAR